jgi:hypothetical protein
VWRWALDDEHPTVGGYTIDTPEGIRAGYGAAAALGPHALSAVKRIDLPLGFIHDPC